MKFYVGIPLVLFALAIGASGIAAVARGWVLPVNRRRVRRVRLFGWGQALVSLALLTEGTVLLVLGGGSSTVPAATAWIWNLLLMAGLAVMGVSQLSRGGRRTL
ncbi:hypothetical protein [Streptomyces sp. NPDC060198]|uniref:hypothetical protein n=1 Tax=Streptomyces sp. NPDC060198 TaxID=3347070 RepID=UPI003646841B